MEATTEKTYARSNEICGLCRFALKDEELVQARYVKVEINRAFDENRCFPFTPDLNIVKKLQAGASIDSLRDEFVSVRTHIYDKVSNGDIALKARLLNDVRLSDRIYNTIKLVHKALAEGEYKSLGKRRFVIVKEPAGKPTLYHISNETTVISHVGQGPYWEEISTIYLGLKIFDVLEQD